jgi:hypothetical protein
MKKINEQSNHYDNDAREDDPFACIAVHTAKLLLICNGD